jgi:hypothetical protein
MKIIKYTWLPFLLILLSCNKGIAPEVELPEPGFSGTVIFIGDWPQDITRTHIVLFKEPLEDSTDFNILNLGFISEEIPFGSSEFNYNTSLNAVIGGIEAREYAYLAVAQSKTSDLSLLRKDWFVVGIYCNETDLTCTGRLVVPAGTFLENINITVDFNNPPPQPPGGN